MDIFRQYHTSELKRSMKDEHVSYNSLQERKTGERVPIKMSGLPNCEHNLQAKNSCLMEGLAGSHCIASGFQRKYSTTPIVLRHLLLQITKAYSYKLILALVTIFNHHNSNYSLIQLLQLLMKPIILFEIISQVMYVPLLIS
jgi:hypothetical protein